MPVSMMFADEGQPVHDGGASGASAGRGARMRRSLARSRAVPPAMCNECGSVRTAKAAYLSLSSGHRPLRCDVCGRATEYAKLTTDFESERCARINAKQNKENAQSVQLQASLAMLDQLGVRFELVETDEWYAKRSRRQRLLARRGRPAHCPQPFRPAAHGDLVPLGQ